MNDILERNKEDKKVNGEFSTIPWPNDKYLRGIRNKRDETKSEADDKPPKERMHRRKRSLETNKHKQRNLHLCSSDHYTPGKLCYPMVPDLIQQQPSPQKTG